MAAGEYVSVSSQNELVQAEVSKERHELEHNPETERSELAATFVRRGVDAGPGRPGRQADLRAPG